MVKVVSWRGDGSTPLGANDERLGGPPLVPSDSPILEDEHESVFSILIIKVVSWGHVSVVF